MFYQNYDDYMRDVFYFNGLSNPNNNNMFLNNMQPMNSSNQNSLNNYYPSVYKIVYPVIQRVISGGNYQFANEDMVNDITNTVLGIVEGDVNNLENTSSVNNTSSDNRRVNSNGTQTQSPNANISNQNSNSLLRDLIKILVIKELISRSNIRRFPYNNPMMNIPYYTCPYMVN